MIFCSFCLGTHFSIWFSASNIDFLRFYLVDKCGHLILYFMDSGKGIIVAAVGGVHLNELGALLVP